MLSLKHQTAATLLIVDVPCHAHNEAIKGTTSKKEGKKKDNLRKGGSVLIGLMIVLAVIIVTCATIAFGYLGATENTQNVMFCGVETTAPVS